MKLFNIVLALFIFCTLSLDDFSFSLSLSFSDSLLVGVLLSSSVELFFITFLVKYPVRSIIVSKKSSNFSK